MNKRKKITVSKLRKRKNQLRIEKWMPERISEGKDEGKKNWINKKK